MSSRKNASAGASKADPAMAGRKDRWYKSAGFAAGVLAAVVITATPFGAWRSLRRAVRDVERQFFIGVAPYGAAADFLADSEDAALGLITVGANYDALSEKLDALRSSRETFIRVLDSKGVSIAEIEDANADLARSFIGLREALLTMPLSEQEAADAEYYARLFESSQGAVSRCGYNEAVEEFNEDVYSRFPASLVGSLFGVDPPESFRTVSEGGGRS